MAQVKDKAKLLAERISVFHKEVAVLEAPEQYSVKGVGDMILDPNVEFAPHAQSFALRGLKIPQSYFVASSDNHKQEIMRHAVNAADPDTTFSVVKSDTRVLAMGPASAKEPSEQFAALFAEFGGRIADLHGNLLTDGHVRAFIEFQEFVAGTRYKIGLSVFTTPLFCRGFSIYPQILEVRCTNGLMDQLEVVKVLRLVSGAVSVESIKDGRVAATAVLEQRAEHYVEFLNSLGKMKPKAVKEIVQDLEVRRFGKGYMERVTPLLNSTMHDSQEVEVSAELPNKIDTARDVLSVLTFAARDFNPATRTNLEASIMQYAREWAWAA